MIDELDISLEMNITRFLDDDKKIKIWPSKKDKKECVLNYLITKFEYGRFYTETEINAIIQEWHTFNDYFLLRRELVNKWLLSRTRNGAKYWREEKVDIL